MIRRPGLQRGRAWRSRRGLWTLQSRSSWPELHGRNLISDSDKVSVIIIHLSTIEMRNLYNSDPRAHLENCATKKPSQRLAESTASVLGVHHY